MEEGGASCLHAHSVSKSSVPRGDDAAPRREIAAIPGKMRADPAAGIVTRERALRKHDIRHRSRECKRLRK